MPDNMHDMPNSHDLLKIRLKYKPNAWTEEQRIIDYTSCF